jgi:hypothetical protein
VGKLVTLVPLLAACAHDVPVLVSEPKRAALAPNVSCAPSCYPAESEPPAACLGAGVSCESRGSVLALALNVMTYRLDEANQAKSRGDKAACQAAARALVLTGRGLPRARAASKHTEPVDVVTRDNQRWTDAGGAQVAADLVEQGAGLYAQCGGAALTTTPAEELALYGLSNPGSGLDVRTVRAIAIVTPPPPCPGASVPLSAMLTFDGAQQKALPEDLAWSVSGGTLEGEQLTLPADAAELLSRKPVVEVALINRPEVHASLEVQPSFSCAQVAEVRGTPGQRGAAGRAGETFDPASARVTSDALKWTGGNGGDGAHGLPAGGIDIYLARVQSPYGPLVAARVVAGKRSALHLFAPSAVLTVDATGGDGGGGGEGGAGGAGQRGESTGRFGGSGMMGGPGGRGGRGGNGGAGGTVTVHYDRAHPELKSTVKVLNGGGAAGEAGPAGPGGSGGLGGFGSTAYMMHSGKAGAPDAPDGPSGASGHAGRAGPNGPAPSFVAGEPGAWFTHETALGLHLN